MRSILISHTLRGKILNIIIRELNTTIGTLSNKKSEDIELPPEPTTCCMSGCANCVWIAYAEELSTLFKGNNEKARELILEKISDPNLRMFLSIELKYIKPKDNDDKDKEK